MTLRDPILGIFGFTPAFGEVPAELLARDAAYNAQAFNDAAMQAIPVPEPRYRPRSIDPKAKLSDRAARLLSLGQCLRPA